MAAKKHLIPFNGTGSATEGLMVILNAGGQAQGYVWEHTYPGGGAALPGKEIPRYVLGENELRVFIQTPGWLHREAGS
ncbi:MAG TPA: hypothetical protein VNN08_18905, partial [Thermoanaerobaculia bacterium]|nr:hypothetical protein [Thermoanaerobaculia bacterium]